MANEALTQGPLKPADGKVRQYGPVASVLALVAFIAVTVLPSSLNLPSANPSEVLEYAPVPPEDDTNPPPASSGASSLGISTSNTLTSSELDPVNTVNQLTKSQKRSISKRCVGARQTEDPNSPPCQSFFQGNNGGKTWQGVTKDEIVIVIYNQGVIATDGQRTETSPPGGTICDIDTLDCNGDGKTDPDPHVWLRVANAYSRYFNARYQTYDRHVHFYYYWSQSGTAAGRRSDAADIYAKLKPFAVIDHAWNGGFHEDFTDSVARRRSMVFTSLVGQAQARSYFQKYAPLVWSYWPDIENWAEMFSSYVCEKVAGTVVGTAQPNPSEFAGQPRKYGFYSTKDEGFRGLQEFKTLAAGLIAQKCGIKPEPGADLTFPFAGWAVDTAGDPTYADNNVATWQSKGVNTIIWFGGAETRTSAAAEKRNYLPEWVIAGDGLHEANSYGQLQSQVVWDNAWVMSYQLAAGRRQNSPAYAAYKEAEPDGEDDNWAEGDYRPFFLVFQAIQVAGPKLTPRTVDAGMHAIVRKKSNDPAIAACYYFPGDYTCVKDANEQWYDKEGIAPDTSQGCYRLVRTGLRYSRDTWAEARNGGQGGSPPNSAETDDPARSNAVRNPKRDPCSGYNESQHIRPGVPSAPGR